MSSWIKSKTIDKTVEEKLQDFHKKTEDVKSDLVISLDEVQSEVDSLNEILNNVRTDNEKQIMTIKNLIKDLILKQDSIVKDNTQSFYDVEKREMVLCLIVLVNFIISIYLCVR